VRRREREIQDKEVIEAILNEARVLRISMCRDNKPYLVPMNFGYKEGCLYLHSAPEGKKIDILKVNPRICFEAEHKVEVRAGGIACNWGMRYLSVIGTGKVQFLNEEGQRIIALNIIMEKYTGKTEFEYSPESLSKVLLLKIEIEEIKGKNAGY